MTGSYDHSAALYDAAFDDITVRKPEWDFVVDELKRIGGKLGRLPAVVEIGCGNGQMLRQLLEGGMIAKGIGVDASVEMLRYAETRHRDSKDLEFLQVENMELPVPDQSYDVAISFLSFRYLDWRGIADEIERVAAHFLMVDMATTVLRDDEKILYEETKKRTAELHARRPQFAQALKKLVNDPSWHEMLKHHPRIKAEEYKAFLTSRFPTGAWRRLYVCFDHSLFTFSTEL